MFPKNPSNMFMGSGINWIALSCLDTLQIQFQAMTRNSFKKMPCLDFSLWGSTINNAYQNNLKSINVFKWFIGNITIENYHAVVQNFALRRLNIFVTIALILKTSYFMCNFRKSDKIINTPQKSEFLIYLHDSKCTQNSQVLFILCSSFKALSIIDFVQQKN